MNLNQCLVLRNKMCKIVHLENKNQNWLIIQNKKKDYTARMKEGDS